MSTGTETKPETVNPWEMTAGAGGSGGDFVPCPPGTHPGTIVGVFDLGHQTQFSKEKNENVEARKLALVVELTKKKPDDNPFILAQWYTWSMRDNSNFFKVVTTLTGRKYADGEKFNPLSLLGKPVIAAVSNSGTSEKVYHNLDSILAYPDGFPQIEPVHFPISWSVLEGKPFPGNTGWLPWIYGKTIQARAEESREYRAKTGAAPAATTPVATTKSATAAEDSPF